MGIIPDNLVIFFLERCYAARLMFLFSFVSGVVMFPLLLPLYQSLSLVGLGWIEWQYRLDRRSIHGRAGMVGIIMIFSWLGLWSSYALALGIGALFGAEAP